MAPLSVTAPPSTSADRRAIPVRGLATYLALTFGLMGAAIAPFALTDASSIVLAALVPVVQWVPALAAVVAERVQPSGEGLRASVTGWACWVVAAVVLWRRVQRRSGEGTAPTPVGSPSTARAV